MTDAPMPPRSAATLLIAVVIAVSALWAADEVLRFEERDELLNLGLYSRRSRLQQPKMSKSDFSPPPRGGVFGPKLGVFDPPPGGGRKVTFFRNFVKFP